jgi:hypothetical protein
MTFPKISDDYLEKLGWMTRGSNPHTNNKCFSSPKHPDWLWNSPKLLLNCIDVGRSKTDKICRRKQ